MERTMIEEDIGVLESLVLGGEDDLIEKLEGTDNRRKRLKSLAVKKPKKKQKRKVAWVDEEDKNIKLGDVELYKKPRRRKEAFDVNVNYKKHLGQRFASLFETPKWAKLSNKVPEKPENDELLSGMHAGDFLDKTKSYHLPSGRIVAKRCRDINFESKSEGSVIRTVEFHPGASIAVVAGLSGIASLFQIDGKNNPKIQSVVFKKFPIASAHFSANGEELIVGSSDYGYFYYYDMMAGKTARVQRFKDMNQKHMQEFLVSPDGRLIVFHGNYGYMHLVTAKTKEWIGSLKMNSNVNSLAFNRDGSILYSFGDNGELYVWDMKTRNCIHKFNDEGCIHGTAVAVSPNNQYLCCGSDTGIVNVYDTSTAMASSAPKPLKVLYNMTTAVNNAKFNSTSELLALSSNIKHNALKLVHFPSMKVFSNFPSDQLNFKRVLSMDFSVNSGYLSLSNNCGTAFLYRLKHFENF